VIDSGQYDVSVSQIMPLLNELKRFFYEAIMVKCGIHRQC